MAAIGICRAKTEDSGAEHITIDYGTGGPLESISREQYEEQGYDPPYDELPPCDDGVTPDA